MPRFVLSVFGVVLMVVVALGVPAQGAAPVPPRDSVLGGGSTRNGPFVQISIDAESDALGGNPSGTASFVVFTPVGQFLTVGGPVTCLRVVRNQAVIGFVDEISGLGPATMFVSDSGPDGLFDGFGATLGATDCSTDPVLITFEFVGADVFDAPSKDQCLDGGWRTYTNAAREPFRQQGDCITFALGVA